jgi:hypothetical protein
VDLQDGGNTDGFQAVQLVSSRDLRSWNRLGNRSWFLGPSKANSGAYDLLELLGPSNVVVSNNTLLMYYTGIKTRAPAEAPDYTPLDMDQGAICLATLRRDGWVSIQAAKPNSTATLTTKTFTAPAGKLYINADASESGTPTCIGCRMGEVRVTLLLSGGTHRVAAAPLSGDMLATEVEWPVGSGTVSGKVIALEFQVIQAALYSYWFADNGTASADKTRVELKTTDRAAKMATASNDSGVKTAPWDVTTPRPTLKIDDMERRGTSFPTVHVSSGATAVEHLAASELRDYLGNMSTTPVNFRLGGSTPHGDVIAVGFGAATALGLAPSALAGLHNDSYVLSSSRAGIPAGSFVASGGQGSTRGSLYAVYDLLRAMGCRFLAPEYSMAEELPHGDAPVALPTMDVTYHPTMEYRDNDEFKVTPVCPRSHHTSDLAPDLSRSGMCLGRWLSLRKFNRPKEPGDARPHDPAVDQVGWEARLQRRIIARPCGGPDIRRRTVSFCAHLIPITGHYWKP